METGNPHLVGMFDSGIGGLSVMQAVAELLPATDILYVADSVHCPYGQRSPADIRTFSAEITKFLIAQGAGIVVVACNTASAAALAHLRDAYPHVPFVGMVPAVKPAVTQSHHGVIGVLATPVTIQGALLSDVIRKFATNSRVLSNVCTGLVEQIEAGKTATPDTRDLLHRCLEPMIAEGMDTLVLGCTHYPFVIPLIRELSNPDLHIVTAGEAVAQQVQQVQRQQRDFLPKGNGVPAYRFVTTGGVRHFQRLRNQLVPELQGPVWKANWRGTALGRLLSEAPPTPQSWGA